MTSNIVWGVILIFAIWFIFKQFAPVKGLRTLRSVQFQEELAGKKDHMLIDVREPHEFRRRHINGAVNVPLSQLKQRIQEIPQDKKIFLYCQSGMRSKQAGRILAKQGFQNVAHLQGGIMAWKGK